MKNEQSIDRVIQVHDIDIGTNIAKLRKSIYSYNRIEKGTQNPTVSFLYACCHILNCDMNTLFNFTDFI